MFSAVCGAPTLYVLLSNLEQKYEMRNASVSGGGCVRFDCPPGALVGDSQVMQAGKGELVNSRRIDGGQKVSQDANLK